MNTHNSCIYYEFSKHNFTNPQKLGGITLFQAGELRLSDKGEIPTHTQVCFEISYVLSGSGFFRTDETEIQVFPGDVHIISSNAKHKIVAAHPKGLRFAFLGFNLNQDFPVGAKCDIENLFNKNPQKVCNDPDELGKLFGILINESYNTGKYNELALEHIISCILILLLRLFNNEKNKEFSPSESKMFIGQPIYDIIRLIEKNPFSCPTVSKIAEMFNYSESYISHLFKAKTGTDIRNYIVGTKLDCARRMLTEEKMSVSETAHAAGYASVQSFCKSFKNKFGQTPSKIKESETPQKADWDT